MIYLTNNLDPKIEAAHFLIAHGSKINDINVDGNTVLHCAAQNKTITIETFKMLI